MEKKISLTLILIFSLGGLIFPNFIRPEKNNQNRSAGRVLGVFADQPENFWFSLTKSEELNESLPEGKIKGGIIPHDTLHSEYIAHFFRKLKEQNPSTILLIAPNHQEAGPAAITTAKGFFATSFGKVEIDEKTVNKILSSSQVGEDEKVIEGEHSLGVIALYLKYYLPQTKVIPLIFKAGVKENALRGLIDTMKDVLPPETVIVATIDFSHYLTATQAAASDAVTGQAIETFDAGKILSFGQSFNDYLDSPPSLVFMLMWFKEKNAQVKILYQTNSGFLSGRLNEPCTSYFEAVFY